MGHGLQALSAAARVALAAFGVTEHITGRK